MTRTSGLRLGALLIATLAAVLQLAAFSSIEAADHGDGALISIDRSADLGDVFLFLDPNDNTKVVMAMTVQGFIVPGEAVNFSVFDRSVRFRLHLHREVPIGFDGIAVS